MKKQLLFFLFAVLLAVSCSKEKNNDPEKQQVVLKEEKLRDVTYGTDARHRMDVFLPEGRNSNTPLVILVHGGSWIAGDKGDMTIVQNQLHAQKYTTVNINYRYASTENHFDSMMEDMGKAVEMITSKAKEWGVRENRFTLVGVSAGAHMSLLYAYGFQKPGEIKSVVSVAGPTDLTTLTNDPLEKILLATILVGAPVSEISTSPLFRQASPLFQVDKAIPTLLMHGTADEIVPYAQSLKLKDALAGKSITHRLVTLEGAKHDVSANPLDMVKLFAELSSWININGK